MPGRAFIHAPPLFLYQIAVAGILRRATDWDLMHLVPPPDPVAVRRSDHCPVQPGQQTGRLAGAADGALAPEAGDEAPQSATAGPAIANTANASTANASTANASTANAATAAVLQAGAEAGRRQVRRLGLVSPGRGDATCSQGGDKLRRYEGRPGRVLARTSG